MRLNLKLKDLYLNRVGVFFCLKFTGPPGKINFFKEINSFPGINFFWQDSICRYRKPLLR